MLSPPPAKSRSSAPVPSPQRPARPPRPPLALQEGRVPQVPLRLAPRDRTSQRLQVLGQAHAAPPLREPPQQVPPLVRLQRPAGGALQLLGERSLPREVAPALVLGQ